MFLYNLTPTNTDRFRINEIQNDTRGNIDGNIARYPEATLEYPGGKPDVSVCAKMHEFGTFAEKNCFFGGGGDGGGGGRSDHTTKDFF